MKKFNYMLEIDILRNSSQQIGYPDSWFWVSKRHPDALLAKTMLIMMIIDIAPFSPIMFKSII